VKAQKGMADATRFYINGSWVGPSGSARAAIFNPADRSVVGEVALGGPADAVRTPAIKGAIHRTVAPD
jgi:aldehyde dehydrogenase (NAD+)